MNKQYIVRLNESERQAALAIIKGLKGTNQKVRRAQILLQSDADGPNWPDSQIASAYRCRIRTVENTRKRFVQEGFEACIERKKRISQPKEALLDGRGEASLIALRLGPTPKGYAKWSLRLLARKFVELGLIDSISHETVRKTLKKTA